MDLFYLINSYFIQFGTGLWLLISLLEWFKNNGRRYSPLFFLGLVIGSIQLRLGFYPAAPAGHFPFVTILLFTSIFAVGPLLLSLATSMFSFVTDEYRLPSYLHFLPPALALVMEIIFIFLPGYYPKEQVDGFLTHERINLLNYLVIAQGCIYPFYFFLVVKLAYKIKKKWEIDYDNNIIWLLLALSLFAHLLAHIGFQLQLPYLVHLGGDFLTITAISIVIISTRYPKFFIILRSELKQKEYENNVLRGVQIDLVLSRLRELMEVEKIFKDDEIRLSTLAQKTLVTPHQLSKIINDEFNLRFNDYINRFRIEETKRLLVAEKHKNIIHIAYEVGFNSKSTFNLQFFRQTGVSPTEFRKKNGPGL